LGATQLLPEEDRVNISEAELRTRLVFLLGGRAAEKLVFDELSAGAEDDLNKATQLARRMVTYWGMSEQLGPVAFRDSEDYPFLGKEMAEPRRYSEHTAQVIDEEISRLLREAYDKATDLLTHNRDKLTTLAKALEESETLDEADIEELLAEPALTGEDRRRLKVYEPAVELLLHGSALERVESLASEYARFTETLDSMPTHHIEGRTARLAFQRDWRCYVGSDAPVRLDGERLQGLNLLSHPYFKDQEVLAFEKAVIGMVGSREERASSETFLKDFFVRHRRNAKRWDGRRSGRK